MFVYSKNEGLRKTQNILDGLQIDVMSDLHLDFYYQKNKWNGDFKAFVCNYIELLKKELISNQFKILIVAGDISHKNYFSSMFLIECAKVWEYVLVVPGNHDLQDRKLEKERYSCLIDELSTYENIVFLMDKAEIFTYENFKFAGTFMSYNLNDLEDYIKWKRVLNEASELSRNFLNERNMKDVEYYNKVINEVDVFVSHVPIVNLDGLKSSRNLFLNVDVNPIEGVLYLCGHTHYPKNSIDEYSEGFDAINVSYGYPGESLDDRKIITTIFLQK